MRYSAKKINASFTYCPSVDVKNTINDFPYELFILVFYNRKIFDLMVVLISRNRVFSAENTGRFCKMLLFNFSYYVLDCFPNVINRRIFLYSTTLRPSVPSMALCLLHDPLPSQWHSTTLRPCPLYGPLSL
jgi:hypothetical protein